MPYLTPDSVPGDTTCRTILVPDSVSWDAIIYGALSELTKPYNWELYGATTVEEATAAVQLLLDGYVASSCEECTPCELADGDLILRLGIGGHVEQFIDGTWQTPEGVYEQPPIPPREEVDDVDKRCNAAANAVNVYAELYEVTTDAATNFDFLDDFLDAVFAGIGEWIGIWAGETAKAFSQLARQFSAQFFFIWESVTEDYWDAEFEDYFKCLLYTYSDVLGDDSVVFDYDAIRRQLAEDALSSLDVNRAFLVAQLEYLFYFAGAADGFNAAGGTTAIDDADCGDCEDVWCAFFDFTVDDGGWSVNSGLGTYVSSVGWQTTYVDFGSAAYRAMTLQKNLSAATTVTSFLATYEVTWGGLQGSPADARNITLRLNALSSNIDPVRQFYPNLNPTLNFNGELASVSALHFLATSGYDSTSPRTDQGGQITLKSIRVRGTGDYPFTGYECD